MELRQPENGGMRFQAAFLGLWGVGWEFFDFYFPVGLVEFFGFLYV